MLQAMVFLQKCKEEQYWVMETQRNIKLRHYERNDIPISQLEYTTTENLMRIRSKRCKNTYWTKRKSHGAKGRTGFWNNPF